VTQSEIVEASARAVQMHSRVEEVHPCAVEFISVAMNVCYEVMDDLSGVAKAYLEAVRFTLES
jgi:hypothetical protein